MRSRSRGTPCRQYFSQLLMLYITHCIALLVCILYSAHDKLCSVKRKYRQQQFCLTCRLFASILASITISSTTTTTTNSSSSSHKHSLLCCTMYCFLRLEVPVVQSTVQASVSEFTCKDVRGPVLRCSGSMVLLLGSAVSSMC